jgi:hypothetical protein
MLDTGVPVKPETKLVCQNCSSPVFFDPELFAKWTEYNALPAMERPSYEHGHRGISIGDRTNETKFAGCQHPLTVEDMYIAGIWKLNSETEKLASETPGEDRVVLLRKAENVIETQRQANERISCLSPKVQKYLLSNCTQVHQVKRVEDTENKVRIALVHCFYWGKTLDQFRLLLTGIDETVITKQCYVCLDNLSVNAPNALSAITNWISKSPNNKQSRNLKKDLIRYLMHNNQQKYVA